MDLIAAQSVSFDDAFANFSNGKLTIGNNHFSRVTDLSQGYPHTTSMIFHGRELVQSDAREADCSFIGLTRPGKEGAQWTLDEISAETTADERFDSPHLAITIRYSDGWSGAHYGRTFFLYPDAPFHGVYCEVNAPIQPVLYWNYRELRTTGNATREDPGNLESRVDSLKPVETLKARSVVEFFGRSDYTSIPMKEYAISDDATARGNLFFFADDAGVGFAWLQEAPPSEERRDMELHDFILRDGQWSSCCWGISPAEFKRDTTYTSYRNAVIFYENSVERRQNIKDYISRRFPISSDKILSMVNPWGCGRFPEYVSPQFLNEDIAAAALCGADGYQIDDSWQKGAGLGDITLGKNTDMSFWEISPTRMNGTFEPQIETARKVGVELALWMAPSTNIELDDWEEFAALMLDYHRRYGFNIFKLDGLVIRTYRAEANMKSMLREVREESGGKIYCNLDTTNGQRSGFFLFLEYGNIFLENRYLWFPRCAYQPEQTLRSLWTLSQYLRPERLQIEIPAPDDLVVESYNGMALPTEYPFEYWCAIALFASPLLWTAPSRITPSTQKTYRHFMELHRSIRERLFSGNIYPIGEPPTGKSICGFYADSGYLLVFREKKACDETAVLTGIYLENKYTDATLLDGMGEAGIRGNQCQIRIPNAPGYALFQLSGDKE